MCSRGRLLQECTNVVTLKSRVDCPANAHNGSSIRPACFLYGNNKHKRSYMITTPRKKLFKHLFTTQYCNFHVGSYIRRFQSKQRSKNNKRLAGVSRSTTIRLKLRRVASSSCLAPPKCWIGLVQLIQIANKHSLCKHGLYFTHWRANNCVLYRLCKATSWSDYRMPTLQRHYYRMKKRVCIFISTTLDIQLPYHINKRMERVFAVHHAPNRHIRTRS